MVTVLFLDKGAKDNPNTELKFEDFVPMMLDLQKIKDTMKKADFIEGFKVRFDWRPI